MIHIIAHRGLRHEAPENTLEAISAALAIPGIYGVEFDVELTQDKRPIVLHQETMVPNENFTAIESATRNFTSRDWAIQHTVDELVKLDAGTWFGPRFGNAKLPLLRAALELPWGNVVAFVELKDATYWGTRNPARPADMVDAALPDLLAHRGPLNVISFNPEILRILRDRAPQIPTTLALWTEWRDRIAEAAAVARACGASAINLPDTLVVESPEWVTTAHEHALKVYVYQVSPARGEPAFEHWAPEAHVERWRELAGFGVDAILSDFARETVALFRHIRRSETHSSHRRRTETVR